MNRHCCKTLLAVPITLFALSMNLGMRFAGNPGDCVVPDDSSFASADGGCKDLASGKVWSLQPDTNWSFESATKYCSDLVEGGQSDWRMATIDELRAVYSHGGSSHLALIQGNLQLYNWSSTSVPGKNYYALRFSDGDVRIFGTKPGSKYGWTYLHTICTRP